MNWDKEIVRRTMEGAGQYPGVQLQLLLRRLEQYPDSVPAIADAIRDMGNWYMQHADALDGERLHRQSGEVVKITGHGEGAQ